MKSKRTKIESQPTSPIGGVFSIFLFNQRRINKGLVSLQRLCPHRYMLTPTPLVTSSVVLGKEIDFLES